MSLYTDTENNIPFLQVYGGTREPAI